MKNENSFIGHMLGILAVVLNILLIVAEIAFIRFGIAIGISIIVLVISLIAFKNTRYKAYEFCAAVCIINILILGAIIVKDSGVMPIIEYNIVD